MDMALTVLCIPTSPCRDTPHYNVIVSDILHSLSSLSVYRKPWKESQCRSQRANELTSMSSSKKKTSGIAVVKNKFHCGDLTVAAPLAERWEWGRIWERWLVSLHPVRALSGEIMLARVGVLDSGGREWRGRWWESRNKPRREDVGARSSRVQWSSDQFPIFPLT